MRITVYDGAGVVGGNKILLESDGKAVFFDFGISYATYGKFYEEFLKPRGARGIMDFLKLGLLPPLKNIYRKDCFPSCFDPLEYFDGHPHCRELEVSGILLSHAHLDHSGHISFFRENVPVFCSPLTAAIAKAVQDTSVTELDKEVCYQVMRSEDPDTGFLGTRNRSKKEDMAIGRPFRLVNASSIPEDLQRFWSASPWKTRGLASCPLEVAFLMDGFEIKRYTVDHSIFGSSAFAVKTKEGWVVYSGDVRVSGRKGHLTRSFAQEAAKLNPLVLITEGTRVPRKNGESKIDVGYDEQVTEESVFEKCLAAVRETKGLVIADFGPRNLERLLTFLDIAKVSGRKLVIMLKDAYLLEAVYPLIPDEISDPANQEAIMIYQDVKTGGKTWEGELKEKYLNRLIDGRRVRQRQKEFIVCMSFLDLDELVDICPDGDSTYIYSSSEAYTEEQTIDFKRLLNWLDWFNIRPVGVPHPDRHGKVKEEERGYHVSGHITAPELLDLIRTVNPRIVIPVHTENPQFFQEQLEEYEVLIPDRGSPLRLV